MYFERMNKNDLNKAIFSFAMLFAVLLANAQQKTIVRASVDRNKILIGEPIQLTLEVDIPENQPILFFNLDSIPHFEFLQKTKIDTSNTNTGTKLIRVIPITSFDSGHWVIPSYKLSDKIVTDTIPIDVGFTPFDPAQDYHDIKDIIEVNPTKEKQSWWWYIAGGSLLLLVLLIYLLLKKKRPPLSAPQPIINPYEEAMKQLEKLQKEKPEVKQYYSQLTDIFRLYVFRRKGILSLQKTTDDLILQLKNINLEKEQHVQLSQALRLSDFVKFAKYIPIETDNALTFEAIQRSIKNIEQSELNPSS